MCTFISIADALYLQRQAASQAARQLLLMSIQCQWGWKTDGMAAVQSGSSHTWLRVTLMLPTAATSLACIQLHLFNPENEQLQDAADNAHITL